MVAAWVDGTTAFGGRQDDRGKIEGDKFNHKAKRVEQAPVRMIFIGQCGA